MSLSREWLRFTTVAVALGLGPGCVTEHRQVLMLDTHPVRLVTPDTPQTLPEHSTSLMGMAGLTGHTGENRGGLYDGPTFNVSRIWGAGVLKHGVADGVGMALEGYGARYTVTSQLCTNAIGYRESFRTSMGGSRFGIKFSPVATRKWFAVKAGGGVATSELGTFVGPDLGISLGYSNPWVTPFLSLNLMAGSDPSQFTRRMSGSTGCETVLQDSSPPR